jgi:hypothetical protein
MSNFHVSFPELISRPSPRPHASNLSAARLLDRCISSNVGYNEQIKNVATDSVRFVDLLLSIFIKKSCRRAYSRVTTRSGPDLLAVPSTQLMAWLLKCLCEDPMQLMFISVELESMYFVGYGIELSSRQLA